MEPKTLADFKAQYPGLFAEAVAEGVKKEQTRIKAWMAFKDIDPKAVAEGIAGTAEVDSAVIAEMSVKAIASGKLGAMKNDNAPAVTTTQPTTAAAKTEAEQKAEANVKEFLANCRKDLNLAEPEAAK